MPRVIAAYCQLSGSDACHPDMRSDGDVETDNDDESHHITIENKDDNDERHNNEDNDECHNDDDDNIDESGSCVVIGCQHPSAAGISCI